MAGPWEVEDMPGFGFFRKGESFIRGFEPVAVFNRRPVAPLAAAVLPGTGRDAAFRMAEYAGPAGYAIYDIAGQPAGHVAFFNEPLIAALHVVEKIASVLESLANLLEGVGSLALRWSWTSGSRRSRESFLGLEPGRRVGGRPGFHKPNLDTSDKILSMRTVARYSFEADCGNAEAALEHYLALADRLTTWLSWKGDLVHDKGGQLIAVRYTDGREASASSQEVEALPIGTYRSVALTEPTSEGALFETTLMLAQSGSTVNVYSSLRTGGASQQPLGPLQYDARCPRVVRDFIGYALPWHYSGDPLSKGRIKKRGRAEGEALAEVVTSSSRMLPLVVVSEHLGFVLHPGVAESLAHELIGLAHVFQIDDDASWGLTHSLGEQWSCYNGAIRLYWPRVVTTGDPFAHPLWTARKLLEFNSDTRISADSLCSHFRRRLTGLSAFTVREPAVFAYLAALERDRHLHADRARLEEASDFRELAESYAAEALELRKELAAKQEDIEALTSKVEELTFALQWKPEEETQAIAPERETPPATIEEAVTRAEIENTDALTFGSDVHRGVEGLSPSAGPPEKVLHYLRTLARLSRAKQAGTLGTSITEWLRRENIKVSQESETVINSAEARANRTFNDGRAARFFERHLKPADAVSPDKCVRIYFDWSEELERVVVGWVGRHPE